MNIPVDVKFVFEGKEYTLNEFRLFVRELMAENSRLRAALELGLKWAETYGMQCSSREALKDAEIIKKVLEKKDPA